MLVAFVLGSLLDRSDGKSVSTTIGAGKVRRNPLLFPILFYAGTLLLSTALSVDPHVSWWGLDDGHGTYTYLVLIVYYFLLWHTIRSRQQILRLILAVLIGAVPVVLYGLAQFIGLDPLSWETDSLSRVSSTMGRSNFFGAYVAMLFPFALLQIWRAPRDWRSASLSLLLLAGSFTSLARGAWLGLVGGVLAFLGSVAYRRRNRRILIGALTVLVMGSAFFVIMNRFDVRSLVQQDSTWLPSELSFVEVRDGTVQSRFDIWSTTLDLIPSRWLQGYGPETFAQVFHTHPEESYPELIVDHPHNLVLDLLMSSGVLGLATFLSILWTFYAHSWKALRETTDAEDGMLYAAVMGSATAFLIQAEFNPNVIVLWALFWMVLAMGSAAWNITEHENSSRR